MNKEFIIWGKPEGKEDETVLHTKSKSIKEAHSIMKILSEQYGARDMRIQVINFDGSDVDFVKAINS